MLTIDPIDVVRERQAELWREAERQRLADQLPTQPSGARRGLALLCYRLAAWLDAPAGYVQMPEAGPEDWLLPGAI